MECSKQSWIESVSDWWRWISLIPMASLYAMQCNALRYPTQHCNICDTHGNPVYRNPLHCNALQYLWWYTHCNVLRYPWYPWQLSSLNNNAIVSFKFLTQRCTVISWIPTHLKYPHSLLPSSTAALLQVNTSLTHLPNGPHHIPFKCTNDTVFASDLDSFLDHMSIYAMCTLLSTFPQYCNASVPCYSWFLCRTVFASCLVSFICARLALLISRKFFLCR